jgi:ABC-type nitrate/sulfonate/bicarbonate transport system substrate-binding protein
MDKIHFPYRSDGHLRLLHVIAESGSWEKHGLDVDYDYYISAEDAHKAVANGSVEFVGGNHLSTYAARTRGDKWVYLGQTVDRVNFALVLKPDSPVSGVAQLKGKVVAHKGGGHPGLNVYLFFKQHGLDEDTGGVHLTVIKKQSDLFEAVTKGHVDAAIVPPPGDIFARRAGLKVVPTDSLPMVEFTTLSSGLPFVENHPDIVERFLKGVIEGIAFFKNNRKESIGIIQERHTAQGQLDLEAATILYDELDRRLPRKPYASMAAINNAYQLGIRQDKAAEKINPMELWNFHYLRRIDDSGFIDGLYKDK